VVSKRPLVTGELERKARVELDARLGRPHTDQEWAAVRRKLLAFFEILQEWDQRRNTERKNGKPPAPREIYPKAA
jgi:hypothetical protein